MTISVSDGNIILKTSQDGTNTLFNISIGEHYHSVFGAYTESQHVFITNGLNYSIKNSIKILEIGFGTGLNAFLSMIEGYKNKRNIFYESIELYPLMPDITDILNYPDLIAPSFSSQFLKMHKCEWNKQITITEGFILKKISGDALKVNFGNGFDVVFFDAFSPEKQPELWDKRMFEKIYKVMNESGVLITYCAKGLVKRVLKLAGFKVERIPGPPGKRHMLRGIK